MFKYLRRLPAPIKEAIKNKLPNLRSIKRIKQNGNYICLGPDNFSYRCFFTSFKGKLTYTDQLSDYDLFIDVGANVGWNTLAALKSNPYIKCLAIEAHPETYYSLVNNISANSQKDRVIPLNLAVSNTGGFARFSSRSSPDQNRVLADEDFGVFVLSSYLKIVTLCLEGLKLSKTHQKIAVKIDVEGHEIEVIKSGIELLKDKSVQKLFCEITYNQLSEALDLVKECGFKVANENKSDHCINFIFIKD